MRLTIITIVALVALGSPAQSRAELFISFTTDGSLFGDVVNVGETVDLPIYIMQTDPNTVLTDWGLMTAGVQVRFTGTTGKSTATSIELDAAWENQLFGAAFDNDYDPAGDTGAGVAAMYGLHAFSQNDDPLKGNPIYIGKVTFQGNVAGDFTIIESQDMTWDGVDFVPDVILSDIDGVLTSLDDQVFATTTLATIVTIPEPSSLLLCVLGVGIVGAMTCLRRRRG